MSVANAIRAGLAYVELFVNDKRLKAGLASAQAQLKTFGRGVQALGAASIAAGVAIESSMLGAVTHFVAVGDALNKMSIRTGMSVEQLSLLGYAADMSDASLQDIQASAKHMARFMLEAASGSNEAAQTLEKLHLELEDLRKLHPDELFQKFGKAIANMDAHEFEIAATAVKVMGRDGQKLLPMFKQLDELMQEGAKGGKMVSKADAENAEALGDAWTRLTSSFKMGLFHVGAALAPDLILAFKVVQEIADESLRWLKANRETVKAIALVGAGLIGIGAAAVVVGTLISAGILSPWVATAAIVTAIAYKSGLLADGTEKAADAARALAKEWGPAMEAMKKAVAGGQLSLAFEILTLQLRLTWSEGVDGMLGDWIAFVKEFKMNFLNGIAVIERSWLKTQNLLFAGYKALETDQGMKDQWQKKIDENTKRIKDINEGRAGAMVEFSEEEAARKAKAEGRELPSKARAPVVTQMSREQWDAAMKEYNEGKTKLRPVAPSYALRPEAELTDVRERERAAQQQQDAADIGKGGGTAIDVLRRQLAEKIGQANALTPPKIDELNKVVKPFSEEGKQGVLGTFSGQTAALQFGAGRDQMVTEQQQTNALLKNILDRGGITYE